MRRRHALASSPFALCLTACTVSWHPPAGIDAGDEDVDAADSAEDAGAEPDRADGPEDAARDADEDDTGVTDAGDAGCDGGSCVELPPAPLPVGRVGFEGALCQPEGALTCFSSSSARRLACTDGSLRFTEGCPVGALCDAQPAPGAATGQCREIGTCETVNKDSIGCVGALRVHCAPDGRADALLPCGLLSHCEGDGECVCDPGATLSVDGLSCEPFQSQGVNARGPGASYCSADGSISLGDARGFWFALLFRTFQGVASTAPLVSQRSGQTGWVLLETEDSVRFELGGSGDPAVFAPAAYTRPQDSPLTHLAVGVYDGTSARLYVDDVATGPAVPGTFTPAAASLCAIGELRGGTSVSSVVIGLVGGNTVLGESDVHALYAETKRSGALATPRDRTSFAYAFAFEELGTPPRSVSNRAGAGPTLEGTGFLNTFSEFVQWGW